MPDTDPDTDPDRHLAMFMVATSLFALWLMQFVPLMMEVLDMYRG